MSDSAWFRVQGFVVGRQAVTPEPWRDALLASRHLARQDDQCPGSEAFQDLPALDELYAQLGSMAAEIAVLSLLPTYHYARIYRRGATLPPHTDRHACEISVSVNLGGDPWPIGIFDRDHHPHTHTMHAGDALFYRGVDHVHWRPGRFSGDARVQMFAHWVDAAGPYASVAGDAQRHG